MQTIPPRPRRPARVRSRAVAVLALGLALVATSACSRQRDTTGPASPTVTTSTPGSSVPEGSVVGSTVSSPATVRPAVAPKGGSSTATIRTPDGRDRTYHVYVPSQLPPGQAVPLLVGLHGGFGSGQQFEEQSGFDGLAEANAFVAVYPDGIEIPVLSKGHVWNGGGCCGPAAEDKQNVDDVGFVSAVIDEVRRQQPIDPKRVYLAGHSNGGIMAYRFACALADEVAAVGMQAGTIFVDPCRPSRAVPLIEIHGTADENMPITGGVGGRGLSREDFPSPAASIARWAQMNGCTIGPVETVDPTNADVARDRWSGCRDAADVEMVRVTGANHAWMGHDATKASEVLMGAPYQGLDSSATIWTFLAAHSLG